MRKVKWVFFGYVAFVLLFVAGIAVAFRAAPPRDPETYYAAYSGAVRTLDPAEVGDTVGTDILSYMFEALYNYRYDHVPYEVVPELASALPEVSADGLTMTVHVRPGIHYYDPEKAVWPDGAGPEVTADDFVYSFKRVCDYNLPNPNYSFVFQDHFAGLDDWWAYTKTRPPTKGGKSTVDYDRPVAGFEAKDHRTLVLHFSKPYPQMLYNLVNSVCSPVSRPIVEHWGEEVRRHPVGTGAYAMVDNKREQRLVFTASPIYRGRPDVDGGAAVAEADRLPRVKRVQRDYFLEPMPVWLLFQQGLFDVEGIPKDAYSQAIGAGGDLTPAMTDKGIVLRKYPDPSTAYIGFNLADPTLGKNRPLRQAMSMAMDRRAYIDKFLNGRGLAAIGPVPTGFPTFDPNRVNPYTQFDLPAARKLMAEAIQINGGPIPPLTILFRGTDTTERQIADFYVDQMTQIGITLKPEFRDFARYLQMVDARQMQLFDAGWSADYPDEQDYFQLFYGPNEADGGLNATDYKSPAFDKLYETATVMPDSPRRRDLYMQMTKIAEEDCPWLIVNYAVTFDLSYDWVGGRHAMDYGHGFTQYVTIDKALRSKRLTDRR